MPLSCYAYILRHPVLNSHEAIRASYPVLGTNAAHGATPGVEPRREVPPLPPKLPSNVDNCGFTHPSGAECLVWCYALLPDARY
eukprot:818187-Rhodomonas_salina.2